MKHVIILAVIVCAMAIAAMKMLDFGLSVANDGMLALNDRYRGRCVSLSEGKQGTILSVRAKTVRISVPNGKGGDDVIELERNSMDRYIVACRDPAR